MNERVSPFAKDKWWLLANALGAMGYLWLSSRTWIEPELRGENVARLGDAVVWFTTALPVFVAFVLADFIWFIRRLQQSRSTQPVLLTAFLWVAVLGVDRLFS